MSFERGRLSESSEEGSFIAGGASISARALNIDVEPRMPPGKSHRKRLKVEAISCTLN